MPATKRRNVFHVEGRVATIKNGQVVIGGLTAAERRKQSLKRAADTANNLAAIELRAVNNRRPASIYQHPTYRQMNTTGRMPNNRRTFDDSIEG